MTESYYPLTICEVRERFEAIKRFIIAEKRMRQYVLKPGADKDAKLRHCDEAMAALVSLKDFAKQHAEEGPEQVALFDAPEYQRGGY